MEWAATQPWSTGHVGMYGKSYDGVTGLFGVALKPRASMRSSRRSRSTTCTATCTPTASASRTRSLTPALYTAIDATPGSIQDDPGYNVNGADNTARPGCYAANYLDQQSDDHGSAFWKARDLIAKGRARPSPLFMTQGFIENNTKPDGAYDFFNGVAGPKRAWFGMWNHVRGNDVDANGRLAMGRHGWFDEVMRFYEQHLRGVAPAVQDPPIAVETSDGSWRSEAQWPPADAAPLSTALQPGSYTDDAQNNGTADGGSPNGQGIWTFSPPLAHDAHLAGVPKVTVNAAITLPDANLVADVYDVDSGGRATLISRGTYLCRAAARSPSTSTATTGSCRPATASACC